MDSSRTKVIHNALFLTALLLAACGGDQGGFWEARLMSTRPMKILF